MTLEMLKKDTYDSGFTAGEKVGEERGISIGLSQGEHKKAIETAKVLKYAGIEINLIINSTGLSPEEREKL